MDKERFYMEIESIAKNEQFARVIACAFVSRLNPSVEELEDFKAAVSEAVTNCIIHAYENMEGIIYMEGIIEARTIRLKIKDTGKGIDNLAMAMAPFYTSKPEMDRSGMGFTFMQSFTDEIKVESQLQKGTTVTLIKKFH